MNEARRLDAKSAYVDSMLALWLASCPEAKYRDGKRALELARGAYQAEATHTRALEALAAAHAETGNFEEAVRWLQRALMFNRFTSKRLWLPLFAAAERWPGVARWMHENMYRGVIVHYFIVGVRDGNRRFGGSPRSTAVEPR